jgi:peptidoglycan/LPS O-acetylase OafA/YrhL
MPGIILMGVVPGSWNVVPGNWSIGVEFTFYAAFPLLACTITSLSRAVYLFLATLIVGATVNSLLWPSVQAMVGTDPADNFLYFWFPNQMSVFALGICVFFLLQRDRPRTALLGEHPTLMAALGIVLVASTAFMVMPHWLSLLVPLPPTFLLVSLAMMIFILALARSQPGPFVNRPMALMGRVSFSAYLLHFAVLKIISDQSVLQSYLQISGWPAIVAFAFAYTGIVLVVLAVSWCSYRLIELPMIDVGKALIRRRRQVVPQSAA